MKTQIAALACVLFFVAHTSFAQEIITIRDMGLRTGVGLIYEPWKNYELSLLQEIRTTNNSTQIDKLISNVGLMYQIDKQFAIAGDFRYLHSRQEDTSISNDIRYNFDLKFKQKIFGGYKIKYRMRYQQKFGNRLTTDRDNINATKTNFRNKIELNYHKNNRLYYTSVELFREYQQYQKPHFNKVRYYLGQEFKYKNGELDLCLGYEQDFGDALYPFRFYFLKTNFTFKLKS